MAPKPREHLDSLKPRHEKKWKGFFRCDDLVPPLCDDSLTVTTGTVETLKGVEVAYWRYTPAKLHKHKYPIIMINGGPGLPHNFMRPTRNFACDGREVIMYDQAGTGESWIDGEDEDPYEVTKTYPELLTMDYYAHTELPALIRELGFDKYHILAESWGTMIAFEFAAYQEKHGAPKGLQSLILNAPIADNHKFIEYQWDPVDGSVGTMPAFTQGRLLYYNSTQDFDNPEYTDLEEMVGDVFNARIGAEVDCWIETEEAGIAPLDYDPMTGPTDIFYPPPDADFRDWTTLPALYKLQDVPVQLNHGGFDIVRPHLIADTATALGRKSVECHVLPHAAHSILLDSPKEVYAHIESFLDRVETSIRDKTTFEPNGTCPVWNERDHRVEYYGAAPAACEEVHSPLMVFLYIVLAAVVAFWFGIRVGVRRSTQNYKEGYEQIDSIEVGHH